MGKIPKSFDLNVFISNLMDMPKRVSWDKSIKSAKTHSTYKSTLKKDVALFQGNFELMAITENLVFTDPYFDADMNHNTPELQPVIDRLRGDANLKQEAQIMLFKFTANAETLLHGDLHSGSVMCTGSDTKVIDPEFGFYGPIFPPHKTPIYPHQKSTHKS